MAIAERSHGATVPAIAPVWGVPHGAATCGEPIFVNAETEFAA